MIRETMLWTRQLHVTPPPPAFCSMLKKVASHSHSEYFTPSSLLKERWELLCDLHQNIVQVKEKKSHQFLVIGQLRIVESLQ